MKIGDRIYVRGYIDEIRKDTVIVRNDGGYFGTVLSEVTGELPSAQPSYTDEQIQKMQELEQAEIEKAFQLGREDAQQGIIRCKECEYWRPHHQLGFDEDNDEYHDYCERLIPDDEFYAFYRNADDFCSRAKRRENG